MLWRLGSVACVLCENAGLFLTCICVRLLGARLTRGGPGNRPPTPHLGWLFFSFPFLQRIACVNTEPGEGSRRGGHTKWQLNRHDPRRLRRSLAVTVSAEKKRGDANKRTAVDMICVPLTAIKPADLTNRSTRLSQTLPSYLCVLTTECIQGSRACWDAKGL